MLNDCAKALTAKINDSIQDGSISSEVTTDTVAVRAWIPRQDPNTLAETTISILPDYRETEARTRVGNAYTLEPKVVVAKNCDPFDNDTIDGLAVLVEEIEEAVDRVDLEVGGNTFQWVGQSKADLQEDILVSDRVFWTVFMVQFRVEPTSSSGSTGGKTVYVFDAVD